MSQCAVQAQPRKEIAEYLGRLQAAINEARETQTELEKRLEPAIHDLSVPTPCDPTNQPDPMLAPIAMELRNMIRQITLITELNRKLLNSVEI